MLRTLFHPTGTREHLATGALQVKGALLLGWLVITMTLGKQYAKDTWTFFPKTITGDIQKLEQPVLQSHIKLNTK